MTASIRVAIADTFWDRLFDLPKQQQKKVRTFVTKFRQDPQSSSINYESLKQACEKNYRSVRIDQTYRCIVLAPEKGNVYCLLWVDHHDDAYDWARRTRVAVNPNSGLLQIYETEVIDAPSERANTEWEVVKKPAPKPVSAETPMPSGPLFDLDDEQLLGIGVPEELLSMVKGFDTVLELDSKNKTLPTEVYEALALYADGCTWKEIWAEYGANTKEQIDTKDIEAAIERDGSKRRFHVVESDEELQTILAGALEKWRVYLHPSQRKLVENQWNGPVRVLGGAGTGKTVVAMHRTVWLVRNRLVPDKKVLFLTYNTNLAADIKHNLSKITTPDELDRVEVINVDAWVSRYLKSRRYTSRIVMESDLYDLWKDVLDAAESPSGKSLPDSFYKEEWNRVILPKRVDSRDAYLRVSRAGRGVALTRPQRAAIWDVFDEMRSAMQHKGWRTYQDAAHDAGDLVTDDDRPQPYGHIVVDETQDMGQEALTLIRKLVPEGENDLFLVGDGHQRIYRRNAVMSHCGISITGRGRKLKINYRTTEQIKRFAVSILEGIEIDNLDGEPDRAIDYKSLTTGLEPVLSGFDSEQAEVAWIAEQIVKICPEPEDHSRCCVVVRTKALRDKYSRLLRSAGLETVALEQRADNQSVPGVRLATMHRVKGLEFGHVFLAGMSRTAVPNTMSIRNSKDPVEKSDNDIRERALVHVAATRAIEHLFISWYGDGCEYFGV